jgi:hypothetical protein
MTTACSKKKAKHSTSPLILRPIYQAGTWITHHSTGWRCMAYSHCIHSHPWLNYLQQVVEWYVWMERRTKLGFTQSVSISWLSNGGVYFSRFPDDVRTWMSRCWHCLLNHLKISLKAKLMYQAQVKEFLCSYVCMKCMLCVLIVSNINIPLTWILSPEIKLPQILQQ